MMYSSPFHLTGMISTDNMRLPWQPRNSCVKYSETMNMSSQQHTEGEEYGFVEGVGGVYIPLLSIAEVSANKLHAWYHRAVTREDRKPMQKEYGEYRVSASAYQNLLPM